MARLLPAALGAALLVPVHARQGEAPIKVTPVISADTVAVSFSAPEALGADAAPIVASGLVTSLTFFVELKRPSSAWFDQTLADVQVASTIKYDNLTGVYHVSRLRGGHVVWSERLDDAAAARREATAFEGIALIDVDRLEVNRDYYISVRVRRAPRRTFPLWPWAADDVVGRAAFTFIR
jgi:hypothetical protein